MRAVSHYHSGYSLFLDNDFVGSINNFQAFLSAPLSITGKRFRPYAGKHKEQFYEIHQLTFTSAYLLGFCYWKTKDTPSVHTTDEKSTSTSSSAPSPSSSTSPSPSPSSSPSLSPSPSSSPYPSSAASPSPSSSSSAVISKIVSLYKLCLSQWIRADQPYDNYAKRKIQKFLSAGNSTGGEENGAFSAFDDIAICSGKLKP